MMASNNMCDILDCLHRKRIVDEQENGAKRRKMIGGAIAIVVSSVSTWYNDSFMVREPLINWDEARRCYLNNLYNGSEDDCVDQLRVSKHGFRRFCEVLISIGGLVPTTHVAVEEAAAIFLNILAHNHKYRVIKFHYHRSKETISRQFQAVLRVVMRMSKEYIKLHECALNGVDAARWKWFKDCLGALDGTHIPIKALIEKQASYRNRKGVLTTNMLGVCDPSLKFIYALPGWEGSTSDSRVLRNALSRRDKLCIPTGNYFLVDADYTNGPGFLAPYRGTRYHLNEWIGNRPQNYKELFNLRHSSARNVIERTFGLLKSRWSILRTSSFFSIKTRVRIISTCCVLHNFILLEKQNDPILEAQHRRILDEVDRIIARQVPMDDIIKIVEVTDEWTRFRDALAREMFEDYQMRRATRVFGS